MVARAAGLDVVCKERTHGRWMKGGAGCTGSEREGDGAGAGRGYIVALYSLALRCVRVTVAAVTC